MKQAGPDRTERGPHLAVHSHGRLVLLRLPLAEQAQVVVILQLGLGKAGFPGPVGVAFHHLCRRDSQFTGGLPLPQPLPNLGTRGLINLHSEPEMGMLVTPLRRPVPPRPRGPPPLANT